MTNYVCPKCRRVEVIADHSGDFVHVCDSGNPAIDDEDVLIIGDYEDYSTDGVVNVDDSVTHTAGVAHKNMGTLSDAITRGLDVPSVNVRGKRKQMYRSRPKLNYVENPEKSPDDC